MIASLRTCVVLSCLTCMAVGCKSHNFERSFFDKPAASRLDRLRLYSLPDQYKIFRYGNDYIEPPAMELAGPIADRGAEAVPFLANQIRASADDDLAIRDSMLVFERMKASGRYNVAADSALMSLLRSRVSAMKDEGWKDACTKMVRELENK